jgi:hypothetical protein
MPAKRNANAISPSEIKTTRSQQSRAVSTTPKSSVNDEYNAAVAVNKELTAGLLGQQPKKMKFVQV